MKTLKFYLAPKSWTTVILFLLISFIACKNDQKKNGTSEEVVSEVLEDSFEGIEIVTNVMDFQTKDTIQSGWNTFKYINKSTEPHFILFDDYPEDKGAKDAQVEVGPIFDKGMKLEISLRRVIPIFFFFF